MKWMLIQKARYRIETRYSPEEVCQILKRNTEDFSGMLASRPFFGTVGDDSFKLSAVLSGKNSWRPILHGIIKSDHKGGSVVWVEAKLYPFVKGFAIFWLCFNGWNFLEGLRNDKEMALTALGMLLFYFVLSNFAFHADEKESRRRLTELLEK